MSYGSGKLEFDVDLLDGQQSFGQQQIIPYGQNLPLALAPVPDNAIILGHHELVIPTHIHGQPTIRLSDAMKRAAMQFKQCHNTFIRKVTYGHYMYERKVQVQLCAISGAYAAEFGLEAIGPQGFSLTEAAFRLKLRIGYDILRVVVPGPTGRIQPLANEIIALNDQNGWSTIGIAEWLMESGL